MMHDEDTGSMLPTTQQQNGTVQESAIHLKQTLKNTQHQVIHDRFYDRLGQKLFESGWSNDVLQWWLDESCLELGAIHGVVSQQHAGALKILAQRGSTYPVGARIPMMGALASWLKSPVNFQCHTATLHSFWSISISQIHAEGLYPCYFPIALHQQAIGLLAILLPHPVNNNQLQTIQGWCGLLGFALHQPQSGQQKFDDSFLQILTPREREVFALLPAGASNAVLAEKLGISAGTVKIHVERILSKLGVRDRTQAAVKAVEAGFTSEGLT